MLDRELELTLKLAFDVASEKRHEYMGLEHLLFALLENPSALDTLRGCKTNVERLRQTLLHWLEGQNTLLPHEYHRETQPTLAFQRVLQRAVFQVQSSGKEEVSGSYVLLALFSEQDSNAVKFLKEEKVTRLKVMNYLSNNAPVQEEQDEIEAAFLREDDLPAEIPRNAIDSYTINLNQSVKLGKVDRVIGREEELERIMQILGRRRKNNPLFVGDPGVGKTAIVEGLARLVEEGKVPDHMKGYTVYALDLGALLAGTKYRGDFEKRLKTLLQQLRSDPKAILFIDEIHTLIGAGAASGGVMDASNLIKPLLASGELKCIGATTFQEYRTIFEKDKALARRFQKIDVRESTVEETMEILKGLKPVLEKHHQVRYSNAAIQAIVSMSNRYIQERFLPDKAIDVMDEVGAYKRLQLPQKVKRLVTVSDIEQIVAKMARIPRKSVSISDKVLLQNLERDLKLVIFGQDEAVTTLADTIKMGRSGLGEQERPVGCFLFAGPTGVGKTEVAKQLAQLLGIELVRFDMSEYAENHTVSRLVGAPPGYVGFEQGGLLTEAVLRHPHCVLLLDEIEKSNQNIFNLLLQIMDYGTLTDSNGRKADFRHVVVIMTTNVGAEEMSRSSMGFKEQDNATDALQSIKKRFPPEFRNRLDAILQFHALQPNAIQLIVEKFLTELQNKLDDKRVTLEVDGHARHWLAEKGYDKHMGARPMARLVKDMLKKPMANEILFGRLSQNGGRVCVTVHEGQLHVTFEGQCKKVV